MKLVFSNGEELEFTSVVIRTEFVSIVRNGRKFYLVNNKDVTEGKEWISTKNAREQ